MRPRLLDLMCGAGGTSVGYARAGFEVVGVDIEPQPHYPFAFIRADALEFLDKGGHYPDDGPWITTDEFDAIHASPPCQNDTAYARRPGHVAAVPALIEQTRELLEATGLPFVIENVPGAPLRNPVQLCGSSFGLEVRRHRLFESNVDLMVPPCAHGIQAGKFPPATNRENERKTVEIGVWRIPLEVQKRAMGIEWPITLEELSEAIPPAYTEAIGEQLIDAIALRKAA